MRYANDRRNGSALVADIMLEERRLAQARKAAPVVHGLLDRCWSLLDVLLDEGLRSEVERTIVALGSAASRGIDVEAGAAAIVAARLDRIEDGEESCRACGGTVLLLLALARLKRERAREP